MLVVVDALRADHLGVYGYAGDPPTSPFIDAWAEGGVRFANVIASSSQTVPSTISLFSGAYPRDHGNQYFSRTISFRSRVRKMRPRIAPERRLLAEVLRGAGFRTGAVVANPWLRKQSGFARGFDDYRYLDKVASRVTPYVRGSHVNELARDFVEGARDERFFLYLHYMDVHSPHAPGPEHRGAFVGSHPGKERQGNGPAPNATARDGEFTRRLYAAEVRGFDDRFGELMGILEEAGVAESTLVVLLADHGDEFLEHGGMGHGWTLFEEVVRVPWVLVHPELRTRAGVLDAPASNVDVAPTLLDLLEVEGDLAGAGRSLAEVIRSGASVPDRARYSELAEVKALTQGGRKVILATDGVSPRPVGPVRAFDLREDPGEGEPVAPDSPWASGLEQQLSLWLRAAKPDLVGTDPVPDGDDPELEAQLRELGYIEVPDSARPPQRDSKASEGGAR